MDLFQVHAVGTASWLTLHGIALAIAPGLTLSSLVHQTRNLTDLETFLGRSISILSLSLALLQFSLSGLLNTFLSTSPTTPGSTASTPSPSKATQTPLLAATTFLTLASSILYYTSYTSYTATATANFNSLPLLFEMACSFALTTLGGGILLFGTGAGSDRKGRSHALFDTPEHRDEVKARHKARKEG